MRTIICQTARNTQVRYLVRGECGGKLQRFVQLQNSLPGRTDDLSSVESDKYVASVWPADGDVYTLQHGQPLLVEKVKGGVLRPSS